MKVSMLARKYREATKRQEEHADHSVALHAPWVQRGSGESEDRGGLALQILYVEGNPCLDYVKHIVCLGLECLSL